MKNISGIVPVILAAVVGIGAVVSLSDYTAPVYGSESEDELTETETIIESAGMESVEETEVENTEAAAVLDGAFDLADGTYEGSANGFSGKIKVSVVIKNQTIRSINILSNSDDEAFFNRAKEGVTASILAKQSTVDEATEHLNAAIKALVKAETKEETKTDVTKLNAVIEKAEALKQSDYTAESWKNLQTALDAAKKLTDATAEQTVVDQAASDLETAILALVKADTENTGTTDKKKKPAVGTVKTVGQIKYKVTGKNTVTVNKYAKKNITKASIPATVKINGYTFKVTAIADSAFSGCSKLTKVTVGSNVKAIGNKSFYKCTKLTTFTASSTGLNKIGKEAFSGDKKLANITLKTTKLKKSGVGKDAFKNIKKNATFKVPAKKVSDYKAIFKSKGAGKNIKIKKL